MAGHARTLLQRLGLRNPQGSCGAFFDGWNSGLAEPLQFRFADPTMPRAVPAQPQAALSLAMQGDREPMLGILRRIIPSPVLPDVADSAWVPTAVTHSALAMAAIGFASSARDVFLA